MLAGATDLQLEVIDEQVVSGTGGIHPDAKVGVASRGWLGKVNLMESGIVIVEVTLRLLIALSRRFEFGAAPLELAQLLPGQARQAVGAVLDVVVLGILKRMSIPIKLDPDQVVVVDGIDERSQIDDGRRVHLRSGCQFEGAGRIFPVVFEPIGNCVTRDEATLSAGEKMSPIGVKIIEEDPLPAIGGSWSDGRQ